MSEPTAPLPDPDRVLMGLQTNSSPPGVDVARLREAWLCLSEAGVALGQLVKDRVIPADHKAVQAVDGAAQLLYPAVEAGR